MNSVKLQNIVLNLFDDGAAATETRAQTAETTATPTTGKSEKGVVLYGKQAAPAAEVQTEEAKEATPNKTPQERKAEYEKMLADYKDLDIERTNKIINNRFKATKELETRLNSVSPILDILADKYHVANTDLDALTQAINSDNTYYEEAAEEAGMSVEQYKSFQAMKRENQKLTLMQEREQGVRMAEQEVSNWLKAGEELKATYPEFDFQAEAQDKGFLDMLKAGIPVRHAYEVLHLDDVKTNVAQSAANVAAKNTVESIRSKGMRPAENGASAQSGVIIKDDVSKFTKEDRAEIIKRARRGERIEL